MYKIIRKKADNINTSLEIVKSIRKNCGMNASEALELARSLKNDSFVFDSDILYVALSPYYEIEVIKEPDLWERPRVPEYSDEEKWEAFVWLEKLSEQERRWIEILRRENPVYIAPTA